MHLDQSAFPGQEQAIDEIVTLALQIAKRQRGEDHLQSAESIKGKLLLEYVELGEALAVKTRLDVLSEVADCTYYTVCLFAINHSEHNLHAVQTFVCQQADEPLSKPIRRHWQSIVIDPITPKI